MESIIRELRYFMENHGIFDNRYNVEIIMNPDDSVVAAADYPGEGNEDGFNIELFFECKTVNEFIVLFKIRSASDLEQITPAVLMDLYHQGRADICCAIDAYPVYYPMQFRKVNSTMMAIDDHDMEHEVPVSLETPQQFRAYTQWCYMSVDC